MPSAPGIDRAWRDRTAAAIYKSGVAAVFVRSVLSGGATTLTKSAPVVARVSRAVADAQTPEQDGYATSKPGGLSSDKWSVVVMADDLAAAGFPAPQKGDRIDVTATGQRLVIVRVDALTRAVAAAIEIEATAPD